jgi:hypothetical protein
MTRRQISWGRPVFPIYSNMPAIGMCTVLACVLGYGLFGGLGAAVGVLSVLVFFIGIEIRRARQRERDGFQAHVDRTQDQSEFAKHRKR